MKASSIRILLTAALLLGAAAFSKAYNDQRIDNLDSLERAVAVWTPVNIDNASEQELIALNRAYRDIMLGYQELNSEKARFYARKALYISVPRNWEEANYDAYRYVGQFFYGEEKYDSAMFYYKKALESIYKMESGACTPTNPAGYSDLDIDDALSVMYGTIGNLYNVMDSIPKAMDYYEKAGKIFEKRGWNESNTVLNYNIGETWLDEKEYKKAGMAYRKALDCAEASGDSLMIVLVYKGFGRMYMETGKTWKSLPYLKLAEEWYAAHPDLSPSDRTDNLEYMGTVLSKQKKQLAWAIAIVLLLILLASYLVCKRISKLRKERAGEEASAPAPRTPDIPEDAPELTQRETCILDLLSKGYTAVQIAEAMNLSHETIRWYRKKLIAKFDVSNTPELISRAKEYNLI